MKNVQHTYNKLKFTLEIPCLFCNAKTVTLKYSRNIKPKFLCKLCSASLT